VASLNNISIKVAGENALIIYFSQVVNAEILAQVQEAERLIRLNMGNEIIELVPSYGSIMVVFNLLKYNHRQIRQKLCSLLAGINTLAEDNSHKTKLIELPVYYSTEVGPELNLIAEQAKLSIKEVIDLHQGQEYLVYAIGFAPGFAYLGDVDRRLAIPRRSSPRLKVPKGAVAIADRQTAVYPEVTPGGWNLIGLCPVSMFDVNASPQMLVKVGDKVKFKAINKAEFLLLGGTWPFDIEFLS
jgi:KipI family sensor histidine kinase inhibitor